MSFLSIRGASFAYPGAPPVLDAIDWTLEPGAFHCLLGRSGCGKTTLLKLAAGLLQPTQGDTHIDGEPVLEPSPKVGFVFQAPTLLAWQSVEANVLLPLALRGAIDKAARERARDLLSRVGLAGFESRSPRELSGGQQSRVAIARALIGEPPALLMDEPFAALDALTREELQDDLSRVCAARGTAVLFVTHDIAEAVYLADRVAVMDAGRITHEVEIALPRPRSHPMRYEPAFNALCAEARAAMDSSIAPGESP